MFNVRSFTIRVPDDHDSLLSSISEKGNLLFFSWFCRIVLYSNQNKKHFHQNSFLFLLLLYVIKASFKSLTRHSSLIHLIKLSFE